MSKIEWTDITWNPVTGCSAISPGCENCYAKPMSKLLLLFSFHPPLKSGGTQSAEFKLR